MFWFRSGAGCLLIILFPAFFAFGQVERGFQRFEFQQIQMGTQFRIVFHAEDSSAAKLASRKAFDRIEELEEILSDYREDSELNQVLGTAVQRAVVISEDLYRVLDRSLYFSRITDGAFDITAKPVVDLWREARRKGQIPAEQSIKQALGLVGYRQIHLNPRTRSLRLEKKGIQIDLGGIAKGFAADQAFDLLRSSGMRSVLVDAGGDIRVGDPPPGKDFWVIENDSRSYRYQLRNLGIATSGDFYQFLELNGTRYSHIIEPKSGLGSRLSRTVTVVALDALTADALATAFTVMSLESIHKTLGKIANVEVRILQSEKWPASGEKKEIFRSKNFPREFLP